MIAAMAKTKCLAVQEGTIATARGYLSWLLCFWKYPRTGPREETQRLDGNAANQINEPKLQEQSNTVHH